MATIHLIPVTGAYIGGVPAVEGDYDEATAAELLAYSPPAFVVAESKKKPAKEPATAPSAETPTDPTGSEV